VLVTLWNILLSDFVAKKLEGKGAVRETLEEIRQVNVHLRLRFLSSRNLLENHEAPSHAGQRSLHR
jgi:hypothetical protein